MIHGHQETQAKYLAAQIYGLVIPGIVYVVDCIAAGITILYVFQERNKTQ